MFSTNLPTETLYKTCFTLGIILFVFVFTVNQNDLIQKRIKHVEFNNKTLLKRFNDSINLKNLELYSEKIRSKIEILNDEKKWVDENRKDLNQNSLNLFHYRIDSMYKNIEKLNFKFDSIAVRFKNEDINNQKFIDEYKMIYDDKSSYVIYFWVLYPFSLIMIIFGFTQWSKNQEISDKTAKLNLEKIELEVKNLKLVQKKDIVRKPRSAKGSLKDQKPGSGESS